jgi:adenylate cyclase
VPRDLARLDVGEQSVPVSLALFARHLFVVLSSLPALHDCQSTGQPPVQASRSAGQAVRRSKLGAPFATSSYWQKAPRALSMGRYPWSSSATIGAVTDYPIAEAAQRAGVDEAFVGRLIGLGVVEARPSRRLTPADVRRVQLSNTLETAGIPLDGVAAMMRRGELSMDFLETPTYERFSSLSDLTFAALAERTGIPIDLLLVVREATGSAVPQPTDFVREDELQIVPFLELQLKLGFRPPAIERLLRVTGDSLRRIAAQEADWWMGEVMGPRMAQGMSMSEASNSTEPFNEELTSRAETALLATWHAQQSYAWTSNIISGLEQTLVEAGLYTKLERPPAMCFLDITGYTRLTQERGDEAAAEMAGQLSRLVQKTSVRYAGKPVKWLGDGVMFYFSDPGPGVVAALDMLEGVADAGLPPAHVGLHAGPVLFQEGDYFGQTVNVASRIAEYARPGEVLVSQAVVDACREADATFTAIGPVELKGVTGAIELLAAHRGASPA